MANELSRLDRFRGCLLGLAVGDALGAPLRGMKAAHVQQIYGEIDGHVDAARAWKGKPNRWSLRGLYTSNTQRALVIADLLARDGQCEPRALADVFVEMADARVERGRWGCHRRVSRNFAGALEQMRAGNVDPLDCGGPSAGCGAAVRVAPIGLFFADDPERLVQATIETSLVTHRDPRAVGAALAVAFAVAQSISDDGESSTSPADRARQLADDVRIGEKTLRESYGSHLISPEEQSSDSPISETLDLLPRLLDEGDDRLANQSIIRQANRCNPEHPIRDPGQGFAPAAATTALYLALGGRSFPQMVPAATGLGRESHDLGAIVGAVVGARDGIEAIPPNWLSQLRNADQVGLRAENVACGEIDYTVWRGVVDLESEATAAEEAERRRLAERWEKQGVLVKKKPRPKPIPRQDFAPPPQTWLQSPQPAPGKRSRKRDRRRR